MWTQLKKPTSSVTYTGGWCLSAVQDAFGTDHPYPTATAQWLGTASTQHAEIPPAGIAVPIFFSFTTEPAGHVAVRFADGTVGSSTQSGVHKGLYIHPNIENLMKVYKDAGWKMTYLGWNEIVGTQRVVQKETIVEKVSIATLRIGHSELEGWDRAKTHVGEYDSLFSASWGDKTANEFMQIKWDQNGEYRKKLEVMANFYAQYSPIIDTLLARPLTVEVPVETVVEKEVIKYVDKIVYQDRIVEVEVVKGDNERSLGDLLSAAFKKLFKVT